MRQIRYFTGPDQPEIEAEFHGIFVRWSIPEIGQRPQWTLKFLFNQLMKAGQCKEIRLC